MDDSDDEEKDEKKLDPNFNPIKIKTIDRFKNIDKNKITKIHSSVLRLLRCKLASQIG